MLITVQHGSADTAVRVMKYRKWCFGGPVTPNPLNQFP